MAAPVLNPPKSILWVDDEGELLEPHRIFLRSKGYTVEWASNADDAVELLRRRAIELDRERNLDWRGWIDRYDELMRWDVDLSAAGEMGLYESLQGLYPDMHREFAVYMKEHYPAWLKNLEGNRPPLSIDIVAEF